MYRVRETNSLERSDMTNAQKLKIYRAQLADALLERGVLGEEMFSIYLDREDARARAAELDEQIKIIQHSMQELREQALTEEQFSASTENFLPIESRVGA